MTWNITTWKLKQTKLTAEERSLVDGTLDRIRRIFSEMGMCPCGKPRSYLDRCSDCWRPTR